MESPSMSSPVQVAQGHDLVESIASVNSPINRIPPEILSKIFLACTICWTNDGDIDGCSTDDIDEDGYLVPYQPKSQGEFTSGSHLPWIEITRVCHHWRSVALACPELWSGLIFSSRNATKQMILLSKSAALVVKARSSNWPEICENVRIAIAEWQRISVLHLQFPADLLQPLVDGLVAAAPKLQSLRLGTLEGMLDEDLPFTLPEPIFSQCTPLRLLELSHCNFFWNSLPLRGLTHLELREPVIPPSIAQILSFLRESRILDTLILHHAFSTDSRHARTAMRLFLPNIRCLTLDDSVDHCADLLEYLTYSARTLVSVSCKISSNVGLDKMLEAIQSAAAYGEGEYAIRALSLSLKHIYGNRLTLRCWASHHSTPLQNSRQPAQLRFTSSAPFGINNFLEQALRATGAALCLTDVQTLYVGSTERDIDWDLFLCLLPNIHTVHLTERFPIDFVAALLCNRTQDTKLNAAPAFLLPRLRSLCLTGVSFSRRNGSPQDAFLSFLEFRLLYGGGIEHICLRHCWELSGDDVKKLKEFVEDVNWDEIEQYKRDYWDDDISGDTDFD